MWVDSFGGGPYFFAMPRRSQQSPQAQRLAQAFDMYETGLDIMRQNLRRRFPRASDAAIEKRLNEWLLDRPGDSAGKPVDTIAWLRRRSKLRSRK